MSARRENDPALATLPELESDLERARRVASRFIGRQSRHLTGNLINLEGRDLIQFACEDYLGLSADERIRRQALESVEREGLKLPLSSVRGGYRTFHAELEKRAAAFFQSEAAGSFTSHASALHALISALCRENDLLFVEQRSSSLIYDAARSAHGSLVPFAYSDLGQLEHALRQQIGMRRKLILVDAVHQPSGKLAPLNDLYELSQKFSAHLILDETAALGILGRNGVGLAERCNVPVRAMTIVSGFEYLLGLPGAVIASSISVCELTRLALSQASEPTLSPAVALPALTLFDLIAESMLARAKLRDDASRVYSSLVQMGYSVTSSTDLPLLVVRLSDFSAGAKLATGLFERGILVCPPLPSGMSDGTCSLRVMINARHTETEVSTLLQAFDDVGRRLGILGRAA